MARNDENSAKSTEDAFGVLNASETSKTPEPEAPVVPTTPAPAVAAAPSEDEKPDVKIAFDSEAFDASAIEEDHVLVSVGNIEPVELPLSGTITVPAEDAALLASLPAVKVVAE